MVSPCCLMLCSFFTKNRNNAEFHVGTELNQFLLFGSIVFLPCFSAQEHKDLHLYLEMFILSNVIMKWLCSLDMSYPFVNLIFYLEWGFYGDLFFTSIPHIFKASRAGFLRFMLFPSVPWEGVSMIQWKERAYLLFLFPIRWGSLGELAAAELPGGRGVGFILCRKKGGE